MANGQVSATLGRLAQRTAYPSELRSNYLLLSASVAPGARTSLSADLEYRQMRDTVAAQDYRSSALSLNYQHEFAQGPTLRAFLRHNNFYRGLLAAEVRERIAGVSLGWSW